MEKYIKRNSNFTPKENDLLVKIAKANIHIIENKNNDMEVCKLKKECWERIALVFNSHQMNVQREPHSLKRKWENIKKIVKDKSHKTVELLPLSSMVKLSPIEEEVYNIFNSEADNDQVVFDTQVSTIKSEPDTQIQSAPTSPRSEVTDSLVEPTEPMCLINGAQGLNVTTNNPHSSDTLKPAVLKVLHKNDSTTKQIRKRPLDAAARRDLVIMKDNKTDLKTEKLKKEITLMQTSIELNQLKNIKLELEIQMLELELKKKRTEEGK